MMRSTIVLALVAFVGDAHGLPMASGFLVDVYCEIPDAVTMAFGDDGSMYVGRDWAGSGGGSADPGFIRRIFPGGTVVSNYGHEAILDPDSVCFDNNGVVGGTPGGVLVGHGYLPGGAGAVKVIMPDESVVPGLSLVGDVNDMEFDSLGRLLVATDQGVLAHDGASSVLLIPTTPERFFSISADWDGRIFGGGPAGIVRVYDSSGTLLDANYASGFENPKICAAPPGSQWAGDLFVADAGVLYRVVGPQQVVEIASGFNNVTDLLFGLDGALYVSEFGQDRILRLAPLTPGDANGDGCVTGADFTIWADNFDDGVGPGGKTWAEGDFTGEGYVTGADFTIWADNFGCETSQVPEPQAAVMGLSCAVASAIAYQASTRRRPR